MKKAAGFSRFNSIILVGIFSVVAVSSSIFFKNGADENTSRSLTSNQPKKYIAPLKALPTEDLVSRHRTVITQATNTPIAPLLKESRQKPEVSSSNTTKLAKQPKNETIVNSQSYYVPRMSAPRGRTDLMAWQPQPIPAKEITEKRQRIAKGERLYERVIIKKSDVESKTVGGQRPVTSKSSNIETPLTEKPTS